MSCWKHATSSTPASLMILGTELWLYSLQYTNTVKNVSSETINVCLNVLFSRLKTPPIIRTEDELKEKIALLEVKRVS